MRPLLQMLHENSTRLPFPPHHELTITVITAKLYCDEFLSINLLYVLIASAHNILRLNTIIGQFHFFGKLFVMLFSELF